MKRKAKKYNKNERKAAVSGRSIDKVTVTNLDIALRLFGIQLHKDIIDTVIDLVELIEEKGDETDLKDLSKLYAARSNGH